MTKYINEETLRKLMYEEVFEKDSDMQKWDSGCWIRYKLFENCLEAVPTSDVIEVRHGRWILNRDLTFVSDDFGHWNCSECGYEVMFGNKHNLERRYLYCPHCGAIMDGGQEDV